MNFTGEYFIYYWYDWRYNCWDSIESCQETPTLITLEFWNDCVNGKKEYKVWDIISTKWLVPFEYKTAMELGLKEGDLCVYMSNNLFKKWEILKITREDGSNSPMCTNWKLKLWVSTYELAPLPTATHKKSSPHHTYITKKIRDDGVEFTEDTIDGKKIEDWKKEIESHKEEIKRISGLLSAHYNLFKK